MIALLQRVVSASVVVENVTVGKIDRGLLVFIGVQPEDGETELRRLLDKILAYRIFEDQQGKMNLSLQDCDGGLLLVPQFTLAADTTRGLRPSFTSAEAPKPSELLFNQMLELATRKHSIVEAGVFGANMQVHLVNDGPVTFWLQNSPANR